MVCTVPVTSTSHGPAPSHGAAPTGQLAFTGASLEILPVIVLAGLLLAGGVWLLWKRRAAKRRAGGAVGAANGSFQKWPALAIIALVLTAGGIVGSANLREGCDTACDFLEVDKRHREPRERRQRRHPAHARRLRGNHRRKPSPTTVTSQSSSPRRSTSQSPLHRAPRSPGRSRTPPPGRLPPPPSGVTKTLSTIPAGGSTRVRYHAKIPPPPPTVHKEQPNPSRSPSAPSSSRSKNSLALSTHPQLSSNNLNPIALENTVSHHQTACYSPERAPSHAARYRGVGCRCRTGFRGRRWRVAQADPSGDIDQSNTSTAGLDYISPNDFGQTFTPTVSGNLTQLDVNIAVASSSLVRVFVRAIETSNQLSKYSVAIGGLQGVSSGWNSFPMSADAPLVAGQQYAFFFSTDLGFPVILGSTRVAILSICRTFERVVWPMVRARRAIYCSRRTWKSPSLSAERRQAMSLLVTPTRTVTASVVTRVPLPRWLTGRCRQD